MLVVNVVRVANVVKVIVRFEMLLRVVNVRRG
jgi:hypothetical protein